jgi:hypothetical protein
MSDIVDPTRLALRGQTTRVRVCRLLEQQQTKVGPEAERVRSD